jgi:hypothetical protein
MSMTCVRRPKRDNKGKAKANATEEDKDFDWSELADLDLTIFNEYETDQDEE